MGNIKVLAIKVILEEHDNLGLAPYGARLHSISPIPALIESFL